MPRTPAEGALNVAETIRRNVQEQDVIHRDGEAVSVTVSVGCATCVPAGGASALDLLAAADRQLYAAKASGRNRISSPARTERPIAQDSPS